MNPTTSNYGADAGGMICGYLIDAAAGTQPIDSEQAALWLEALGAKAAGGSPSVANAFVWLHFNLAHTGALPWLRQHAALAPEFFDMTRDRLHSTRIERTEQSLIAVINDVNFDFAFEPSEISTLWIHVEQHLVVTARQQPLRSVDKLREAVKGGQPLRSAADLLEQTLELTPGYAAAEQFTGAGQRAGLGDDAVTGLGE